MSTPCVINVYSVHLIIAPPGQANRLRVIGFANISPSNQVTVTVNAAGQLYQDSQDLNEFGNFVSTFTLPLGSTLKCSDPIIVDVEAVGIPNCRLLPEDRDQTLRCCEANLELQAAPFFSGSLTPPGILVRGAFLGCFDDQLLVGPIHNSAGLPVTNQSPVTADVFGQFEVVLQILPTATVNCDEELTVRVCCALDPSCCFDVKDVLRCGPCARAQISIRQPIPPCVGTPPTQHITFDMVISIPAGETYTFEWDFGDSSPPASFQIDNSAGTAATQHFHSESHDYGAGTWTARLVVIDPPNLENCSDIPLQVVVQCGDGDGCPTATGSVTVGDCDTTPESTNFGYRPVMYTLNFSPAIPQNCPAWVTWNYGGSTSTGATTLTQMISTATGSVGLWTHQVYLKHKPGGYSSSATLMTFCQGQACAPSNVQFEYPPGMSPPVVLVGSCIPCPDKVEVARTVPASTQLLPCAPTTTKLEFQASVVWPSGTASPPSPSGYDWTITLPGQPTREAKYTNGPAVVDTTSGWTGSGATASGAVDLRNAGTYAIGVTAKFPISAGLPTHDDGTSDCNLTGSDHFTLSACCPTFIGQLNASEGRSSCEWLFSIQVDNPNEVQKFDWAVDGQPIPGNGATNVYTFPAGTNTTRIVTVTMTPKSLDCPTQSLSTTITIDCPATQPGTPPKVTGCSVVAGSNGTGSIRVIFDSDLDPASATNPSNFSISISGGSAQNPAPGSLSYDSASKTTTITGLSINPGDTVSVTVTGVKDATGTATIGAQNTAECSAPPEGGGGTGGGTGDGEMGCACILLLWIAFAILVLSAFAVIGAFCAPPGPTTIALAIAAAVLFVIALILFGVWVLLCGQLPGACRSLNTLECILSWIIALIPIIAIIVGISAGIACGIGVLVTEANWGLFLVAVREAQKFLGCPQTASCFIPRSRR